MYIVLGGCNHFKNNPVYNVSSEINDVKVYIFLDMKGFSVYIIISAAIAKTEDLDS